MDDAGFVFPAELPDWWMSMSGGIYVVGKKDEPIQNTFEVVCYTESQGITTCKLEKVVDTLYSLKAEMLLTEFFHDRNQDMLSQEEDRKKLIEQDVPGMHMRIRPKSFIVSEEEKQAGKIIRELSYEFHDLSDSELFNKKELPYTGIYPDLQGLYVKGYMLDLDGGLSHSFSTVGFTVLGNDPDPIIEYINQHKQENNDE